MKKLGIVLLIIVAFIVFVVIFIRINILRNPPIRSVNMGSAMSMITDKTLEAMPIVGTKPSNTNIIPVTSLSIPEDIQPVKKFTLTAQVIKRKGLPDEWTYNGTVPGPQIRVSVGDHVCVILVNHLPVSTSIHWHGIEVPNASDGVAGLTQDAVKPGESYMYDFIAKEPGTYWFHSHQLTSQQEPKGLFGALIVDPKNPLIYDHDYTLVYHDAQIKRLSVLQIVWERIRQLLFGIKIPQAIAINNKSNEVLQAKPLQTIRIRVINASGGDMTGTPLKIIPLGVSYKVVSLDGHDINEPQLLSPHVLQVGSGQRYDLIFTMPSTGSVKLVDIANNETATIGTGETSIPKDVKKTPLFDFTSYGVPFANQLTNTSHFDATYSIILDDHPGFRNGSIEQIHTINGNSFPAVPMITVKEGQSIHLHIVNKSNEYHPMHLHGHIFSILAINGKKVTGSPIRMDSVLVGPNETADVAFVANNPGLWMFHCHILIHAEFGMDMMVVYPNISTPFTVGTKSGNFPD